MPGEIKTGVVITADTKGFDQALQKILKVNDTALQGMKDQAKSYEAAQAKILGLEGQLSKLAKTQAMLYEAMAGAKDKSSNVYKAMAVSMKLAQEEAEGLAGAVKNLEKAYSAEAKAAQQLQAAEDALARTEERKQQAAQRVAEREADKKAQAEKDSRWAFSQGFLQTAMPFTAPLFLQRGPGFWRQAAGQMAGGAVRGLFGRGMALGGAALQAPFQGAQGLAQIIGAMPVPGAGAIAGAASTAIGYAGRGLEWRRQQLEALPFLGGRLGIAQAQQRAGGQYARDVGLAARYREATTGEAAINRIYGNLLTNKLAQQGKTPEEINKQYMPETVKHGPYAKALRRQMAVGVEGGQQINVAVGALRAEGAKQYEGDVRAAQARRTRTIAAAQQQAFEPVRLAEREGLRFGMAKDQALQAMTGVIQAGGGRAPEFIRQNMLRTSMAARAGYGIAPEVSGAFLQAGRRGGMVGGPGRADQMLTRTLADGIKLGLEGSELTEYMQSMADGIKQWEQTGIPIATDAIQSMATVFSTAGIAGPRAARMAQGFAGYVQNIGAQGPQGGLDMMLLRSMGGYTGQGGAAEYEQAVIRMEELGGKLREGGVGAIGADQGMADTMRQITEMGGGGATGRFFLRSVLGKRMGIQMSQKEVGLLEKQLTGAQLTPEEQQYTKAEAARRAQGGAEAGQISTPEKLAKFVEQAIPAGLRAQAAIQNKQIAAGEKMITVVNQMDMAATSLVKVFANLAGDNGVILKLTKKFELFGEALDKATSVKGANFEDIWSAGKLALGLG